MKKRLTPFLGDNAALHLVSASVAGAMSTTAIAPLWLVKTRLQLQTNEMKRRGLAYRSSCDCIKRVYREEGLRGFYKGLAASYLGKSATPETTILKPLTPGYTAGIAGLSIQFTLYEKGKKYVLSRKHNSRGMHRCRPSLTLSLSTTFGRE